MSSYTTINEYNSYLVDNQVNINIIDFVKEINKIKYNIDISFIDEFLELVSKNECCIHHDMLQKYGIISLKNGSTNIKRLLEQNEFIENEDFELLNVEELRPQGGISNKNEYLLHPRAFKICLVRSLKTKKYARYYLLLEECIKYFNDYQYKLKEKYIIKLKSKIEKKDTQIIIKDDKIDELIKKTDELLKANKETNKYNEEILKRSKKMESQLNEALEKLDITNDKLDDANEELEDVNERLDITDKTLNTVAKKLDIATDDRVIKTKKSSILEYFIIMYNYNTEYKYYIIRGQKRYINKKMDQLDGYTKIKTIECVPNANILWNFMKEELKNSIDFYGNKLNLINLEENDFLLKVDEIYNKRKNVIL